MSGSSDSLDTERLVHGWVWSLRAKGTASCDADLSVEQHSVKEIILMPRCGGADAVMAVAFSHPSSLLSDPIIDDASALCQIPA